MVLNAIKYVRGKLEVLDQLRLPHDEIYVDITGPEDAWHAIRSMQVRGAPMIALVAVLSLAVWGDGYIKSKVGQENLGHQTIAPDFIAHSLRYLVTSRPTAVNLADAAMKLENLVFAALEHPGATGLSVIEAYIQGAEQMLVDDVRDNERIGRHGADWVLKNTAGQKVSMLTHCNTGSLATAGYGTALGVIRSLHAQNALHHVYYTETRPYNQGSRLTGYELIHDTIPATLITDSMAAALLQLKGRSENIAAVVVGADRVAANGDTANKIGTYALAVLARHHQIKFLVAAPRTTIDLGTASGLDITIEERSPSEVTTIKGPRILRSSDGRFEVESEKTEEISIAAQHTQAWNPAFDVTPAALIDGIVTELGVVEKNQHGEFCLDTIFNAQDFTEPIKIKNETEGKPIVPNGLFENSWLE